MFFSSPGVSFWTPKMGPEWGPNRIFDAEGVKKPLASLFGRSWSLLGPKKSNWERLWDGQEAPLDRKAAQKGGGRESGADPSGRGFGESKLKFGREGTSHCNPGLHLPRNTPLRGTAAAEQMLRGRI